MLEGNILILAVLSIVGGVIAGLGGPGGMPVIIGIFELSTVSPSVQAGTTSAIFVFATLFASAMYAYSGNIRKDLILYLVPPTFLGTPAGVFLNQFLSKKIFGALIGVIAIITGITITYRETKNLEPLMKITTEKARGKLTIASVGFFVGLIGGMTGIGGPALSIPILIMIGIPALESIGAGLVQGFFVTSSSALNYVNSGKISLSLMTFMGVPYVLSQVFGWYYAQNTDAKNLKIAVSILLAVSGLYLIFF